MLVSTVLHFQAYHFPVQPTFAEETEQCLPKILTSSPPPILKVCEFG